MTPNTVLTVRNLNSAVYIRNRRSTDYAGCAQTQPNISKFGFVSHFLSV